MKHNEAQTIDRINAMLKSEEFQEFKNLPDEQSQSNPPSIPILQDVVNLSPNQAIPGPTPEEKSAAAFFSDVISPSNSNKPVNAKSSTSANQIPHSSANLLALEEKLALKAEIVLQDIVDEYVPMIEADLRRRLKSDLDQHLKAMIEEKMKRALTAEDFA